MLNKFNLQLEFSKGVRGNRANTAFCQHVFACLILLGLLGSLLDELCNPTNFVEQYS